MNPALFNLLQCAVAGCGGRLAIGDRDGSVLRCRRCPAHYPVLADIPIVVPSPTDYLASYRDAVLATLAELGAATRRAVAVVDGFAAASATSEPLAFSDDWVAREGSSQRPVAETDDDTIAGWLAAVPDPSVLIASLVPSRARTVVEIGCGGNLLAAHLSAPHRDLVVTDLSFRAVARTAAQIGCAGVVLDAAALPLRRRSVDVIIAANLIDLLDDPVSFLRDARAAVRARGRIVLSTPDPSLGTHDPDALNRSLGRAGLAPTIYHRGQPWLRGHSGRHYQLYFADVLVAEPV